MPLLILIFVSACHQDYVPKPRDYIRISYPEKSYRLFDTVAPFRFLYPSYAQMLPDSSSGAEPFWYNLEFKPLNGTLYLSYKNFNRNPDKLISDSRNLVYKHSIKAESIEETVLSDSSRHVYGILYDLKGNTASSLQFFVTDSSQHFLRGSLYFLAQPDKDSMAPVIRFVRQDVIKLIESLEWKNNR